MNNALNDNMSFCYGVNDDIRLFKDRTMKVFSGELRVFAKRVSLWHIGNHSGMSHQPIGVRDSCFGVAFFSNVLLYLVNVAKGFSVVVYGYGVTFFHTFFNSCRYSLLAFSSSTSLSASISSASFSNASVERGRPERESIEKSSATLLLVTASPISCATRISKFNLSELSDSMVKVAFIMTKIMNSSAI